MSVLTYFDIAHVRVTDAAGGRRRKLRDFAGRHAPPPPIVESSRGRTSAVVVEIFDILHGPDRTDIGI